MISKEKIQILIDEFIADTELFLVDLHLSSSNCIQISIDSLQGVDIDTCVQLSRYIESKLDRDEEDYQLEVSSAGISAPFKMHKQYIKHISKEVCVQTNDNKKITGVLQKVNDTSIVLAYTQLVKTGPKGKKKTEECVQEIPFADIKQTTLVIKIK